MPDMGGTVRYTCTIPAVPPSLNEYRRMSMYPAARRQKAFQEMVWAVLNEKGNRCPRGLERVDLRAVMYFTVSRKRDGDNYGAVLWKWFQDVLVREGVIPDDTADRCTSHSPVISIGEREATFVVMEGT